MWEISQEALFAEFRDTWKNVQQTKSQISVAPRSLLSLGIIPLCLVTMRFGREWEGPPGKGTHQILWQVLEDGEMKGMD